MRSFAAAHVHADTIAIYPAYDKKRPNYWFDLRDGEVYTGPYWVPIPRPPLALPFPLPLPLPPLPTPLTRGRPPGHGCLPTQVEFHELIDFVHDASNNDATRRHVLKRIEQLSPRGIREGLPRDLMGFEESLGIDERRLVAANLTKLKDEL